MPQIIACEWRVIFSENLLHKTVYPLKDPWFLEIKLLPLQLWQAIVSGVDRYVTGEL